MANTFQRALFSLFALGTAAAHGQDAAARIDHARQLRLDGNAGQSIQALQGVMANDPSNFRGQYNLALALAENNQKDAAISAFEKAVDLGEKQGVPDATVYNSYGWFLMQQGKYAAAERQFKTGTKYIDKLSDKSRQRLLNNLGLLYMQTDQLDKAQTQFAKTESDGAKKGIEIIKTIQSNAAKTPPTGSSGLLYLGETQPDGKDWAPGSATTSAATPAAVRPDSELQLSTATNLHAEAKAGGDSVAGPTIGVLNAGDAIRVLSVRASPAPSGGKYVWAAVQKDASAQAVIQ